MPSEAAAPRGTKYVTLDNLRCKTKQSESAYYGIIEACSSREIRRMQNSEKNRNNESRGDNCATGKQGMIRWVS